MTDSAPIESFAPALDRLRAGDLDKAAARLGNSQGEQLLKATRVVLRKGETERVLRTEQGIYFTIRDPSTERTTVRLFEGPALREIMLVAVSDYVERGFEITDWTLAEQPEALETTLLEAQSRGNHEAALKAARELLIRAPDDARLAALGLAAAVAQRGYAQSVTLSQRSLSLGEEPDWALRQHAALLHAAGHRQQCLGVLFYLKEHYGPESMTAEAWELLATCFVGPLHRPGVAETFIQQGLSAHPDHPGLQLLAARAKLDAGEIQPALEVLAPALAAAAPSVAAFVIALQAHLESGLEGTESLAHKAVKIHPRSGLLKALSLEVADRPGPSLKEYRSLLEQADGPAAALDLRLNAMRAALRVGSYEQALRLAREAQTEIGEPDPRCLSVMYDSLRALEPTENREDLADMVAEARRNAGHAELPRETVLQAILSAGIYLEPAALEPLWKELGPTATPDPEKLRPQTPLLGEGLLCLATQTGFVALFDEVGLAPRLGGEWDWFTDAETLKAESEAGRVAVASGASTVLWVRVTTLALHPADTRRYRRLVPQPFTVSSGQVYVGGGEALHGNDKESVRGTLGQELGGRDFYLAPGKYQVTVYERILQSWPTDDVRTDPCDVIFQLAKG